MFGSLLLTWGVLDDHLVPESEIHIQHLPGLPGSFRVKLARVSLSLGPRPEGYLNLGASLFGKAVNPSVSVSSPSVS